mmetsp:Transcript_33201/g.87270  ORF Transcript_33201/g.87270 Transcript_33201/m.87270 type:complete len:284 (-) Transcript_33201:958-1809(-)
MARAISGAWRRRAVRAAVTVGTHALAMRAALAMAGAISRTTAAVARCSRPASRAHACAVARRNWLDRDAVALARAQCTTCDVTLAARLGTIVAAPATHASTLARRLAHALTRTVVGTEASAAVLARIAICTVAPIIHATPAVEASLILARGRAAARPVPPGMADTHAARSVAGAMARAELALASRAGHLATVGATPAVRTHTLAIRARAVRPTSVCKVVCQGPPPTRTSPTIHWATLLRAVETAPAVMTLASAIGNAFPVAGARVGAQPLRAVCPKMADGTMA